MARERGGRKDEIVRAAFQRVAEAGFEGLRLRQIAEDVGIDHSTLHHHVPTKQDIVNGVAQYATEQFWHTMPTGLPAAATLHGYLDNLHELMQNWPELFLVTIELDLRARRDPAVRDTMRTYETGWRHVLRKLVTAGNAEAAWVTRIDPEAGAELLIAATKGVRLTPEHATAVHQQLTALFLGDAVTERSDHPAEDTGRERRTT